MLKRFLATFLLLTASLLAQTDKYISSGNTSPYLTLGRGLQWQGQGNGTIGQNFIFNPLDPNQGFCVFVYNNNPSNSHTFTLTVAQAGDPAVNTYSGNTSRWNQVATTTTFPATVNPSTIIGINYKTTASAVIVISFTGNSSAAGSPDTADVFTVQTNQSSCGSLAVNSVQGPFNESTSITQSTLFPLIIGGVRSPFSANPLVTAYSVGTYGGFMLGANGGTGSPWHQTTTIGSWDALTCNNSNGSDQRCGVHVFSQSPWGTNQMAPAYLRTTAYQVSSDPNTFTPSTLTSFFIQASVTNPGANVAILHHFLQGGFTSMSWWNSVLLGCSATCEIQIRRTTAQGTTCSALTIHSANLYQGTRASPASGDVAENACTGQPTLSDTLFDEFITAGSSMTIDLQGFLTTVNGTGAGLAVVNVTSLTGVATATLKYSEMPD